MRCQAVRRALCGVALGKNDRIVWKLQFRALAGKYNIRCLCFGSIFLEQWSGLFLRQGKRRPDLMGRLFAGGFRGRRRSIFSGRRRIIVDCRLFGSGRLCFIGCCRSFRRRSRRRVRLCGLHGLSRSRYVLFRSRGIRSLVLGFVSGSRRLRRSRFFFRCRGSRSLGIGVFVHAADFRIYAQSGKLLLELFFPRIAASVLTGDVYRYRIAVGYIAFGLAQLSLPVRSLPLRSSSPSGDKTSMLMTLFFLLMYSLTSELADMISVELVL